MAALRFDFSTPASENGCCGYAGITVFGAARLPPAALAALNAPFQTPDNFVMNIGRLVVGRNNELLSTTNLATGVWIAETNFVATQSVTTFSVSTSNELEKFYRVAGY